MDIHEILIVTLLALFPALGNFAGGLAAEWLPLSKKNLNRSLHAAAGVMLAIVAIEVMPEAMKNAPAWLLSLMFFSGGCSYLMIDEGIKRWQKGKRSGAGAGAWMIYLAVAADLVGDGLLIGAGSAVSIELALVLSVGQVMADLPCGYAVIANFRSKGMPRKERLTPSASFIFPVVGAALVSYFALREQGELIKMAALVFVAGIYCLAAVEDMIKEAHEIEEDTRLSALSFLAGFALFLVVSGGFK